MENKMIIGLLVVGAILSVVGFAGPKTIGAKGEGVSVSYPPNNKELDIPTGEWAVFDINLVNNSGEPVVATVSHSGLDVLDLDYPESVYIEKGGSDTIPFKMKSGSTLDFSGMVNIEFKVNTTTQGAGGRVIQSFGVPVSGKASPTGEVSRRGVREPKSTQPSPLWNEIGFIGIGMILSGVILGVPKLEKYE